MTPFISQMLILFLVFLNFLLGCATLKTSSNSLKTDAQVKIAYDISTLGETENIRIVESSQTEHFDKAAVDAVKKWRFKTEDIGMAGLKNQEATLSFKERNEAKADSAR